MPSITPVVIKTKRLLLRPWKESDFKPFAELNADPRVMEFFPSTLSREKSDELGQRISSMIEEQGWGFWAVELTGTAQFIGMIGINQVPFTSHFTPAVEIGWRLAYDFWGKGYALEGAKASLEYGFQTLLLDEIVSFTTLSNLRSQRVMQNLGMHCRREEDFEHPKLEEGHPLRRHVLYRLRRQEWITCSREFSGSI
ncbi:MAG: GNAT family N-acetyltransferase [Verrucomicrobia bacterium]|nr:GNAT family N-acetyltransferase [Verrucomicrobiota bacterium]